MSGLVRTVGTPVTGENLHRRYRIVDTWNGGKGGRRVVFVSQGIGNKGHNECFEWVIRNRPFSFSQAAEQGLEVGPLMPGEPDTEDVIDRERHRIACERAEARAMMSEVACECEDPAELLKWAKTAAAYIAQWHDGQQTDILSTAADARLLAALLEKCWSVQR